MEPMPVNSFKPVLLPHWSIVMLTRYGQSEEKDENKLQRVSLGQPFYERTPHQKSRRTFK